MLSSALVLFGVIGYTKLSVREFPDVIAVAVGAFGDPNFPDPRFSVYEGRRHRWVTVGADVEHSE